jgi:hypothetical protein
MIISYRTKDGMADYKFSFEYLNGSGYRAYILDMPSYGGRDKSLHITHRLKDGERYYICWSQPLHTLEDLKKVVAFWSDLTQTYIRTGMTIDQQLQQANILLPGGSFSL